MGQYWLVTCPAQKEYTQHPFGMKLAEVLFSSWPAYLIVFLIEPLPRSAQRDRTTGNGGLRSYEVLERINKHSGVQKVSAKEPTSPSKHSAFGHWIGKRIICVGDYLLHISRAWIQNLIIITRICFILHYMNSSLNIILIFRICSC
jgi:hypothetical protein